MLEVIEVTEGRWQVIDERGRFVAGFAAGENPAEAFANGYKLGREDGAMVHARAVDGLDRRMRRSSTMTTVIKVLSLGSFEVYDEDVWVRSYDPDGGEGAGDVVLTTDLALAARYVDVEHAMRAWRATSATHPVRRDGKPNRPLTAYSVEFEPVDDALVGSGG